MGKKLALAFCVMLFLVAPVFAQTGTASTPPDAVGALQFLFSPAIEAVEFATIDRLGLNPDGSNRVGAGYFPTPVEVSFNSIRDFGAPCATVVPYYMNSRGQLIRVSSSAYTCNGETLILQATALTLFAFYTFPDGTTPFSGWDVVAARPIVIE